MEALEIEDLTDETLEIDQSEYKEIHWEIENQPYWRSIADKEMDYADGNQLDGQLLQAMKERGIPPAVEDLIGPSLLAIRGYEKKIRTDWRVTPNGNPGGQDVADAISFKLNEAERHSKADKACSDAFKPQIACGLGWVEVTRNGDPFDFPYRCLYVHRNQIHWDMKSEDPLLSDARFLRRQRWLSPRRLAMVFPQHKELILVAGKYGGEWWTRFPENLDGDQSTGLNNAWDDARAWTMAEDRWYNPTSHEVCVTELWYRRWVQVPILKSPDGRVVEYDENNLAHAIAVSSGKITPTMATVTRVRRSYWMGSHKLYDGPTPFPHRYFPYVPFWGFREDMTGIPYGYVRGMKYAQDSLNSGVAKLRWGMSVVRVERTKGAVAMTDDQFRRQSARPDADILLDAEHMAKPGARFEVKRDYQLTEQHFSMLNDNRNTIGRVSNITAGFMGKAGTARSGKQEDTQVEQSNQALEDIMDNFRAARSQIGELLMSLVIEDIGDKPTEVTIEGDAVIPDRTVVLNKPEQDPATGMTYLSNDLLRTRLKVALEDVPSTNSYRGQQLAAMSEAIKSLPAEYQAAALPFLVSLMDVPFKREVVEAIRAVGQGDSPEQIEARIKQAVDDALAKAGNDLKARELDIKERKTDSEIKGLDAKTVQVLVQAVYSAMQAGGQVAQMPMIAPVADKVMEAAGYQKPNPAGVDPNFPVAEQAAAVQMKDPYIQGEGRPEFMAVNENTSPAFPPVPDDGGSPMTGIETPTTEDNMSGAQE